MLGKRGVLLYWFDPWSWRPREGNAAPKVGWGPQNPEVHLQLLRPRRSRHLKLDRAPTLSTSVSAPHSAQTSRDTSAAAVPGLGVLGAAVGDVATRFAAETAGWPSASILAFYGTSYGTSANRGEVSPQLLLCDTLALFSRLHSRRFMWKTTYDSASSEGLFCSRSPVSKSTEPYCWCTC